MSTLTFNRPQQSTEYTPAPAGTHRAVIVDAIDRGWEMRKKFQSEETELQPIVRIVWQIDELMENGRRYSIGKNYKLSTHPKSSLYKDLMAWQGRDFDQNEQVSLENFIGTSGALTVIHKPGNDGRIWSNIGSLSPLMKGLQPLEIEDYVRIQDRPDYQPPEHSAFEFLPAQPQTEQSKAAPVNMMPTADEMDGGGKVEMLQPTQIADIVNIATRIYSDGVTGAEKLSKELFGKAFYSLTKDEAGRLLHEMRQVSTKQAATAKIEAMPEDREATPFDDE